MNSMERVLATLAAGPLDRRPFCPVLSLYGARLTNASLESHYSDATAFARGQAAVRSLFDPDILFGPFAFALIGKAFGSEVRHFPYQAPNIRRPAIFSADQMSGVILPDPETNPHLLYFRESVRQMAIDHRGEVPIAMALPSPIDLPPLIMGTDAWLDLIISDIKEARNVLDYITGFFVRFANGFFDEGATLLGLTCVFATTAMVTRELVTDFCRPGLEQALQQLKGPVVLHHGGSPFQAYLDLLADLPRVVAVAVDHRDDLDQVRSMVGEGLVVLGGVNGPAMASQETDQVERDCMAILENRRSDPKFILATAGADIPYATPPENIHALRRTVERFARGDH